MVNPTTTQHQLYFDSFAGEQYEPEEGHPQPTSTKNLPKPVQYEPTLRQSINEKDCKITEHSESEIVIKANYADELELE